MNEFNFTKHGLLLIKIGAILAFALPLLGLIGYTVGSIDVIGNIPYASIAIGFVLGVLTLKFLKDIIAGERKKVVYAVILGAVMFALGSNIPGALVGIGAFLCYVSTDGKGNSLASQA